MKHIWISMLLIATMGITALAQNGDFTTKADSDPKAKAALDKMRKKYEGYSSLEVEFSMVVELPEQPKALQKGKILQKGTRYRLDFNGQTIISDGKSLWVVLPKNKEVQINDVPDADEDDAILSPQSLFRIYEKQNFTYALINEYTEAGKLLQEIEFKPLDRFSEYSKLRLTLNKTTSELVQIKGFTKDGARYTFAIVRLTPNKPFADTTFSFSKSAYPGYHIEDLRN